MKSKVESRLGDWNARVYNFPFGIDTEVFSPSDKKSARQRFGIDPDSVVVATRATDHKGKRFDELCRALDRLSGTHRKITLLTIDQQGLVAKLTRAVTSIELPWTNNIGNLVDFYRAADVFAMPSTIETFGMMTLEAMSTGVPVITVQGTASSEISACTPLEVNSTELIDQLTEVLAWSYDNPEQLEALGRASRMRAEQKYGIESYLSNLVGMYEDVLERHHAQ
jgi:glycosyltransferase involved in cell wall biosynthesis